MRTLFARLSEQQVNTYRLVLSAAGIPHTEQLGAGGWVVRIPAAHRAAAIRAVSLYLTENRPETQAPDADQTPQLALRCFATLCVVLVLVGIHWTIRPGHEKSLFVAAFSADAARILDGELYRCVTALLFHKDAPHLIANIAGLLVFGTIVESACGWGIGWLLIVAAGATGNYVNAVWYRQAHISIGASTAVFAAVGVSAAWSFAAGLRRGGPARKRAWLSLAAGIAFLGFTGAAAHTDLLAHLFGFGAGLVFGGVYAWLRSRPLSWPFQAAAMAAVAVVAAGAWTLGMLRG